MDTRERHFGPIAAFRNKEWTFDVGALVRRLILFEHCFLESSLLREMPALIQVFGYDGVIQLLEEPGFDIISGAMTAASAGQNTLLHITRDRGGVLPLGAYNITTVTHVDPPDEPFAASLKHVDDADLNHSRRKRLKRRLLGKLMPYPEGAGNSGISEYTRRLDVSPEYLGSSLRAAVARELDESAARTLQFEVQTLPFRGDYAVKTNLATELGMGEQSAHKLVERVLLGVAATHQRISLMRSLNAVTGFRPQDAEVFSAHLDFLLAQVDPNPHEATWDRVIRIGGLPTLNNLSPRTTIDVRKLLDLRHAPECVELRRWLRTVSSDSDLSIAAEFNSVREKLAAILHSQKGETVRFLATNGLGMVPEVGPALGPLSSLGDQFLVEKVIGAPGPVSFLNRNYRSIFNS